MANENASNYSIQPGVSVDYPKPATPMDPSDHPANNMPDATQDHWGTVNEPLDYYHKPARDMIQDRLNSRS